MANTATAQRAKPSRTTPATTDASLDAPSHALWWAAAVCAVATLLLAYPALGGGFLVSPTSDQYRGAAVRLFGTHYWLTTGHIPEWNPYLYGGMPFIASQNGDVFYPTALLRVLFRGDIAITWAFVTHEFLAGWFGYAFLRSLGLSFYGALVGGLAYMMGGPLASYVSPGHDGKLYVSALFPIMAMLALYCVRGGRRWSYPALALVTGLGVLTPHPQLMQYCLLGVGAVALFGAFWEPEKGDRIAPRVAFQRLGLILVAIGVGFLIGAIYYAPVLAYVPYSPRAHGALVGYASGWDFSTSYSMLPEELINTYLPEFTGILDSYFGRNPGGIHFHSEFIGAAVYCLAGGAAAAALGHALSGVRRRTIWFWVIVVVIGTLWSLGGYTPFYHLVYALVPGTHYFRAPGAFFIIPAFGLAALAGEGLDAILHHTVPRTYAFVAAGVAAFIAVLAVSGALTTLGGSIARPEQYDLVVANASAVTFGAIRALLAVLAVTVVLALVSRTKLDPVIGGYLVLAVVTVELWSIERLYWKFSAPASVIYASDAAIDLVKREPQPGRMLAQPLVGTGMATGDAELEANMPMMYGIRQVRGYHGNEMGRYDEMLDRAEGYRDEFNPQVWRLLNIRFLLTNVDSIPVQGATRVAGPLRDAAGSTGICLFRLPGDNPVAWVTPLAVKAPDDAALVTVKDPRFDPLRAAIFDTAANVPVSPPPRALPDPLPVSVTATRYDPGHMTFKLSAPAPAKATLVVSENYYPGWKATVDGKAAPAARVDYTLIGVPLAAGATAIDLTFHDPALPTGERITFAALLVALAWLAVALFWRPAARGTP